MTFRLFLAVRNGGEQKRTGAAARFRAGTSGMPSDTRHEGGSDMKRMKRPDNKQRRRMTTASKDGGYCRRIGVKNRNDISQVARITKGLTDQGTSHTRRTRKQDTATPGSEEKEPSRLINRDPAPLRSAAAQIVTAIAIVRGSGILIPRHVHTTQMPAVLTLGKI